MNNTKTSKNPRINLKNLPPLNPSILSPPYLDKYENPSSGNHPIVANPSSQQDSKLVEFDPKTDFADGNSNNTKEFNLDKVIEIRHSNLVVEDAPRRAAAKSQLHEICAANNWKHPLYECCKEEGPCHMKLFTFKVVVEMQEESSTTILECFSDPRPNKKMAADRAAEGALWYLRHVNKLAKAS
ncbi:ribonuclease 3-like protein 1 [Hibiscus syriacus]|uniref:ribonuclease 3-like protein 1 n=1 Tax=Hibiscus syriacus TaxID=106335 RepID=UPI0019232952|nr:ribonuclease 3-like protein 1 [Hibiscus syriacus]